MDEPKNGFAPDAFADWVGDKTIVRNFEKGTARSAVVVSAVVSADGSVARLTLEMED